MVTNKTSKVRTVEKIDGVAASSGRCGERGVLSAGSGVEIDR